MRADERGFVLTAVLITFIIIEVIVVGVLSVVMSDLHGAVGHQLAMQSVHVAEAGLNFGVARLVARAAAAAPTDESYAGEPDQMTLTGAGGRAVGTFRVAVRCAHPREGVPPDCRDDPSTAGIDESNLRVIVSLGALQGGPGRARRQIEALVRRYTPGIGGAPAYGVCGREGVELGPGTTLAADVGSNGDVRVEGPRRDPGTIRKRLPAAPLLPPTVQAQAPATHRAGLTGAYSWRVSFVDAYGAESGGSPPTQMVWLADQHARLTNLPVGDRGITRRRIYRTLQDSPRGPWFLVAEIMDDDTGEYIDYQPDEVLRWRMPGGIDGSIAAGGTVSCSRGCANQVDGVVRTYVREVVCPNFLPPPVQPAQEPAQDPIIQTEVKETVQWGALRVGERETFTIQTLSVPGAELHIHLSEARLERGAALAITGQATVYFHVAGAFVLGPGADFGTVDFFGRLVRPSDRVQVFVSARDAAFAETGSASVRLEGENRVSSVLFAPNANIVVDRAVAFSGALYGRYIRIDRSTGFMLDPIEGFGSERIGVRPSPYQYMVRWYDNPTPGP